MARKKTVNARKNQDNDMKSVQTKHGYLTFINNPETRVFEKIRLCNFLCVNTLSEAEKYNADQLVQKNVLEKIEQNEKIGYRAFSHKIQL
jgi:hypothetical protein